MGESFGKVLLPYCAVGIRHLSPLTDYVSLSTSLQPVKITLLFCSSPEIVSEFGQFCTPFPPREGGKVRPHPDAGHTLEAHLCRPLTDEEFARPKLIAYLPWA
jgi:hypothetical protein